MRQSITAPTAAAVGPYSHAVDAGELIFLSGQTPLDPQTKELVQGDIGAQTRQCLDNLAAVLGAAGLGPDDIVRCTIYLTDMADYTAMNDAYAGFFAKPYPARTCVAVKGLPLGARVEIEAIARRR